jgi:hypothetical protein
MRALKRERRKEDLASKRSERETEAAEHARITATGRASARFGDVVLAPPVLTAKPRSAPCVRFGGLWGWILCCWYLGEGHNFYFYLIVI